MKIANAQIDFYIQKISQEKIAGCLVYGPETSVVDYRFDLIAKKISPDLSDPFLVTNISKERLAEDKGILSDEFFSLSMLGGRKLILVKNADIAAGGALKILFEESDFAKKSDNFILIHGGDLDKSSPLRKAAEDSLHFAVIACYEDDERTIKNFIAAQLLSKQVKSTPQVLELLLEKFGKNRQIILLELEKILIFLGDQKELTAEIVNKLTASEAESSSNEFVMNFAAQKFDVALMQAERLFKDGFEAITLIRFLSNYLQKLYHCKVELELQNSDFEEVVKSQRLFFKTEIEFRKHLKTSSLQFLTKNLQDLANLEIKIKSGIMPAKLAFLDLTQSSLRTK
ncbi:MAG: DNA polymerase III subunit delta [Rickettsiales bacterium]|nr:DNA polymerase III subunit delta [Rickettsiales bacterium]